MKQGNQEQVHQNSSHAVLNMHNALRKVHKQYLFFLDVPSTHQPKPMILMLNQDKC